MGEGSRRPWEEENCRELVKYYYCCQQAVVYWFDMIPNSLVYDKSEVVFNSEAVMI